MEVGLIAVQSGRGMFTRYNIPDDPLNRFLRLTFGTAIPAMFPADVVPRWCCPSSASAGPTSGGRAGRAERVRTRLVGVAAPGYAGLFALLIRQATRGEPLVHPGGTTWAAPAVPAVVVAAGTGWALRGAAAVPPPVRQPVPQR